MANEKTFPHANKIDDHKIITVGVLGFGHMGQALCQRLSEGGFKTIVYDRDLERVQREAPPNVQVVSAIDRLAACDAILTSLPEDDALNSVTKSPGGLFSTLRKNALNIATSTVSPALSRRLAASHLALSQGFLVKAILGNPDIRSEEHTSELHSLMRIPFA